MIFTLLKIIFLLEALIFLTAVFMHLVHKNLSLISLYRIQSFIISIFIFSSAIATSSVLLMLVGILMFGVKVIVAPYFFTKLIKDHQLKFTSSMYFNVPLTLLIIATLTGLVHSHYFQPLTILAKENANGLLLALATILISIFLLINRKGGLSQMVGVLSLENAIVSFAFLSGLEATPNMQIGIIFDLLVWVVIASIFAGMIHEKFGTLDSTVMNNLKEE